MIVTRCFCSFFSFPAVPAPDFYLSLNKLSLSFPSFSSTLRKTSERHIPSPLSLPVLLFPGPGVNFFRLQLVVTGLLLLLP